MPKSNNRSDIIDITCVIVGETERAWRIDHGGETECWVPKSLCEWSESDGTLAMPEWIAMEKGLI